jgi:exodeoxyribonuclease VII small subunit
MSNKTKNNFEESIERLEKIVNKMESGDSSLEKNLIWFEEGMELIKLCQGHLTEAEKRVQRLIKKNDDGFEIKDVK